MMKKCPNCKQKAVKLYINRTIDGKRKWLSVGWYCTSCQYIYQVASDTLIFKSGELVDPKHVLEHCPKCGMKLVRSYRHKNPKHGKQQWLAIGKYCKRCKYNWVQQQE